jgi:homoserine dehydrogenase
VLSRMDETGCTMDEAIAAACASGYAEEDPSVDLDGADAAAKLAILCALGFGLKVSPVDIDTRTTSRVTAEDFVEARQRGITIRQIAHADFDRSRNTLTAWVAPIAVRRTSTFGQTEGPNNAAVIGCVHAGEITLTGAGAGGDATAVAVLSDLITISRDRAAIVPAPVLVEAVAINGFSERKITSLREAV